MQNLLNFLFDSVFLVGGTYLGTGFVLGIIELWHKSHPDVSDLAQAQPLSALPAATSVEMQESRTLPDLEQIKAHQAEEHLMELEREPEPEIKRELEHEQDF